MRGRVEREACTAASRLPPPTPTHIPPSNPTQLAVKNLFIRGSVVRYVRMAARNVDTTLLEDATRRGEYTVYHPNHQKQRTTQSNGIERSIHHSRAGAASCIYLTGVHPASWMQHPEPPQH